MKRPEELVLLESCYYLNYKCLVFPARGQSYVVHPFLLVYEIVDGMKETSSGCRHPAVYATLIDGFPRDTSLCVYVFVT